MGRRRPIAFAVLLLLGVLVVGSPAAHATSPRVRCGDVLTSDTRLTRSLRCAAEPGLTLAAGVTLDLGGHSIVGPGTGTGIVTNPQAPTTIRNGVVRGWRLGVQRDDDEDTATVLRLEDVLFRENRLGVFSGEHADIDVHRSRFIDNESAISTFYANVSIVESTFLRNVSAVWCNGRMTVVRSRFTDNARAFDGYGARLDLADSVVSGSAVVYDNYDGVGALIEGNTFARNGVVVASDFSADTDKILRNRFVENDVAVRATTDKRLVGNTFIGNRDAVVSYPEEIAPGAGFVTMEGNIFLRNGNAVFLLHPASVKDTVAVANTGYGIYAPLATDLGGNVAYRNGVEPQCTGVVCAPRS